MKFLITNIELFIVVSISHVHYSSAQTYALLDGGQYSACPAEHNGKRYRSVPQDSCREAIAWHPGWGGNVPETVQVLLRSEYPCGCIINHATMCQIFIYPDIMYNPHCDLYGPTMRKSSIGIVCEEVLPSEAPSLSPTGLAQQLVGKVPDTQLSLEMCDASANNDGTEGLSCAASIDIPFGSGRLKVALEENACAAGNGPSTINGQTGVSSNSNVTDEVNVVIPPSEVELGTLDSVENTRTVTKNHCFRADFYPFIADGELSDISVTAKKWNIETDYIYEMDGTFTASVTTSEFVADATGASDAREVTISARIGPCSGTAKSTAPFVIGDVVEFCVWNDDMDVEISGFKDVKFDSPETFIVDNLGGTNFVTKIGEVPSSEVTIETLMVPAYYDERNGDAGTMTLTGVATVVYNRRLSDGRTLQEDNSSPLPFSVEIPLAKKDLPEITVIPSEGSFGTSASTFGSEVLVAACVLFNFLF
mmetsp:Transcript_2090/g.4492  ORF Transcript_2090/g.4492 Transcript_2090/m.4492 type:complete len:478 (-) Transcript_2090:1688-3121(-)|eukprot:CAMPEP_0171355920 /NCGR_PEP_ID=MMETSP0878-20121228/45463_1 /TAXON_ID=67004 /ORGANISM="Thalassiosira weissflogii, Strain CCMP1336" /LENGTH=477 /DNA_ID=CAMNT_0011861927 /DNA_START=76 /DNA_END=1509 /DNA_ORIENTATION=-